MNTKVLPGSVLDKIKTNRTLYQFARVARSRVGSAFGARSVEGITGRVHFNDFMLGSTSPEDAEHYARAAREIIGYLEESLAAGGKSWKDLNSVLEFGAGYGRVTRFLVQKVDPSKITVCDVIEEASQFCAQEFRTHRVPSTPEIQDFQAPPTDLLFFISVQTHLSLTRLEQLQAKLRSLLNPGGIVLFTTMGMVSAKQTERYGERWHKIQSQIVQHLDDTGFFFEPYGYYKDPHYGMTWETYEHTMAMMHRLHGDSMRLLRFSPGIEDGHQDIYAFQRVA